MGAAEASLAWWLPCAAAAASHLLFLSFQRNGAVAACDSTKSSSEERGNKETELNTFMIQTFLSGNCSMYCKI